MGSATPPSQGAGAQRLKNFWDLYLYAHTFSLERPNLVW